MPTLHREFLNLAFWCLCCRWKACGHAIEDDPYPGDLQWYLLGMRDYAAEMRLVVEEMGA